MTITYNKKEAEKELSIKEMQEKTIVAQNERKIKRLHVTGYSCYILIFLVLFLPSTWHIFTNENELFIKAMLTLLLAVLYLLSALILNSPLFILIEKMIDKPEQENKDIKTHSLNAEYHKYHENKELFSADIFLNTLRLVFVDKDGERYCESIDIKNFERVEVEGPKGTEVNLYEKKIYKSSPKEKVYPKEECLYSDGIFKISIKH